MLARAYDRRPWNPGDLPTVNAVHTLTESEFQPDFVGPRHRLRESLLLRLLLSARPGPALLNVGAGQGTFSQLLESRGFAVTSVDPWSRDAACQIPSRPKGATIRTHPIVGC